MRATDEPLDRLLVIDDEESTRELLKLSLASDGYQVWLAENGCQGLEVFETADPDIVLTDIKMPGMDGIEVLRRLKAMNPDVEVIVITGHGQMELAVEALQLDASDFITKPIGDRALNVALRRAREKIWMRHRLQDYTTNLECRLKEAIEEVRKRYDFERRLIHASMDGIIANDLKGNIIIFNEGASRIYGYTHEEALCGLHVARLYPRGTARRIKQLLDSDAYGGPGRLINYETHALTRDGRLVPILLSATVIQKNKKDVAIVGFFKDLTEIRRLQEDLLDKTRMAAVGEAMFEVAHGVKNILHGMKLGAYMVEAGLSRGDTEKLAAGWRNVKKNMERVARLALDMLSYARKDSERRSEVSLNEVVREVCDELTGLAETLGIVIRQDLEPRLPLLRADREALHTVVSNLVGNALEAIHSESVDRRVTVRTFASSEGGEGGEAVGLEVSDTGRGFGPELKGKIFQPLFSTKGARGTGLGLAIVAKIVAEHGGRIGADSEPGCGSRFTVIFAATPIGRRQEEQAGRSR